MIARCENAEGDQLTALLDTLHSRIASRLVHRVDGIFDGGARILPRIRACRKADALGDGVGGSSQGGARSSNGNGSEERHIFCRVLEMI